MTDLMSKSVPSTSYLLATEEMSGLFLMFWPLALQVTLGKGRPVTPQLTRWFASLSFTICRVGQMSVNTEQSMCPTCVWGVSPKFIGWTTTRSNLTFESGSLAWLQMYSPTKYHWLTHVRLSCLSYPRLPAVLTWTPGRGPRAWSPCGPWPPPQWRWSPAPPLLTPGWGAPSSASPPPRPDTRQRQSCHPRLLWSPAIVKLSFIKTVSTYITVNTFLSPGWRYKDVLELSSETAKNQSVHFEFIVCELRKV